ncbi:MAG: DUF4920 domain-containing protein [Mucilaginibacter sp.]
MKVAYLLLFLLFSFSVLAQKRTGLVHGKIFGSKPDTTGVMAASKVEDFMDKKVRISVAVRGKILNVTKEKGGWFTLDAGNGRTIAAHFKNYAVSIPTALAGWTVVLDGIAQKQFLADDQQHYAGDTVKGKKQSHIIANAKRRLTFEVSGMMVDKQ